MLKKRPFLLAEVLVAFLVATLCVVPLVRKPLLMYRDAIEQMEEMEKERLADWTFSEVKEILLKNEVPWSQIPRKSGKSLEYPLPNGKIQLPGGKAKKIRRKFILNGKREKMNPDGKDYRYLEILIYLDEKKYSFTLPVQKLLM